MISGGGEVFATGIGAMATVVAAALARWGTRRSGKVAEAATVIDGYANLMKDQQAELVGLRAENARLRGELDAERQRHIHDSARQAQAIEAMHTTYAARAERFITAIAGLKLVVRDEVARSAADVLLDRIASNPEYTELVRKVRAELERGHVDGE